MNSLKFYCYAQHCPSRNGQIVPESEIRQWFDENPGKEEAGELCDDWNLIAEGSEQEIVDHCRDMIRRETGADSNAAFSRRQYRNVLDALHRPETPARMIDRNAWEADSGVEFKGEEFDREDIESEQPEKVADLWGQAPLTEVWRCGETPEEYTYYAVAK